MTSLENYHDNERPNHLKVYLLLKIMMFHSHVSFPGCSGVTILLEKPNRKKNTRTKKKHFYFNASLQFQSNFHIWNKRQRWLADGPMEKSRSLLVNHKPLDKVTKCLDFQVWKKTTDLKPLTDFRLPPQPLRISGHDNEEGFFRGKNSTKISCFDIFISTITVSRSVLGSWLAIPERDLAKHEDFIAGLSGPAPC